MIDYIRVTIPFPHSVGDCPNSMADYAYQIAKDVMSSGKIIELARGSYGYHHSYSVHGSGRVMWGEARMGVCVELPGTALRTWESHNDGCGASSLLGYLLVFRVNSKVTRLDVAIDTDLVHIHQFRDAARAGKIVCASKNVRYLESFSDEGDTLYIGSRTSDRMLRVYNKAVEQNMEPGIVLTRVELETKGGLAQATASALIDGRVTEQEVIASYADFRELDATRTNKRTRCSWWDAILESATKVVLAGKTALVETVERKLAWVQRSVAPTLALLSIVLGSTDWLRLEVQCALERVSEADLALLA